MINGAPSEAHGGTTLQLDGRPYSMMKAFNVMNSNVVSVGPDVPIKQIARVLVEKGISAVPVLDESGAPIGMVSEGDLVRRSDVEQEARRDWWLILLAEGEVLNPDFLAHLRAVDHKAKDVMSCPVVTVTTDTDVTEVAELLVVIARHIDHARAVLGLAENRAQHVAVRLRPVDRAAQAPHIDDVADKEQGVHLDVVQKIEQPVGAAALEAQMDV